MGDGERVVDGDDDAGEVWKVSTEGQRGGETRTGTCVGSAYCDPASWVCGMGSGETRGVKLKVTYGDEQGEEEEEGVIDEEMEVEGDVCITACGDAGGGTLANTRVAAREARGCGIGMGSVRATPAPASARVTRTLSVTARAMRAALTEGARGGGDGVPEEDEPCECGGVCDAGAGVRAAINASCAAERGAGAAARERRADAERAVAGECAAREEARGAEGAAFPA